MSFKIKIHLDGFISNSLLFLDVCGLRNNIQVEILQDQTHLMLQEYCGSKAQLSTGKLRFGKILLTMPIVSQICPRSIEALFFRKTVGNIAVERVISDLLHGGSN